MSTPNAVWIPTESNSWELAKWLGEDLATGMVTVEVEGTKAHLTLNKTQTHQLDPSHLLDLDDLCQMNNLHEAPLLNMLKRHLLAQKIYTNTGDVLISLNPYKDIAGLYSDPLKYLSLPDDDEEDDNDHAGPVEKKALVPHVYSVANKALRSMMFRDEGMTSLTGKTVKVNQSVIVSGESGAGKTEASKYVMGFLIAANESLCARGELVDSHSMKGMGDAIKHVLLESSLVFEAFGNAKTVRNDNSSRFGKYIKLQYTSDNRLVSAFTETFLLEKSRLVNVGQDERNYHVFYQMVRGMGAWDSSLASKLQMKSVDDFKILTEGHCTVVTTEADDARDFSLLCHALETLGCSKEEMAQLWSLLACILHLGNFSSTSSSNPDILPAIVSCQSLSIENIGNLLGVQHEILVMGLTTQQIQIAKRDSVHTKILTVDDVQNNTLALMKYLYKSIFAWLVRKINSAHASADSDSRSVEKFIGILDIFGFEILRANSFEQLCINFTNERLQQQFNEQIFVAEQEEYAREGLNWTAISFRDNQDVIDLISKKPHGLLFLLEEHGMMNRKPDDGALLNTFNTSHERVHAAYSKSRFGKDGFIIKHFAGDVTYAIEGFIVKNNDSLQDDLMESLQTTTNTFLLSFIDATSSTSMNSTSSSGDLPNEAQEPLSPTNKSLPPPPSSADKGGRKMASAVTVSYQFRNQLDILVSGLWATEPHYIKCIKPNADKAPCTFSGPLVMEQLKYSGALEVVRIRREGFPTRVAFQSFYSDYEILCRNRGWKKAAECTEEEAKRYAGLVAAEVLQPSDFQVGHHIMFMRDGCIQAMRLALLTFFTKYAVLMQTHFRRHRCRTDYKARRKLVVIAQAMLRMIPKRRQFKKAQDERRAKEAAEAKARAEAEAEAERKRIAEEKARAEAERVAEEIRRIVEEEKLIAEQEEAARLALLAKQKAEHERREEASAIVAKNVYHFTRRLVLRRRIDALYDACAKGNLEKVKALLKSNPDDLHIMSKFHNFKLPLHASLRPNATNVYEFLKTLYPANVLTQPTGHGNSAVHDILLHASETTSSYLAFLLDKSGFNEATKRPSTLTNDQKAAYAKKTADILRSITGKSSLKEGSLSKKRDGNKWQKRWSVMTESHIAYYKEKGDTVPKGTIPLKNATIKRVVGPDFVFEIESPELPLKKNIFGSHLRPTMSFLANSEIDLQEWITPLKPLLQSVSHFRSGPIAFADLDNRSKLLSQVNWDGETPLHTLARHGAGTSEDPVNTNELEVALWLVDNGCPLGVKNKAGKTAEELARDVGNLPLATWLEEKAEAPRPPIGPFLFPGYSFLSLNLQKMSFTGDFLNAVTRPVLVISVYTPRKQLLEQPVDVDRPVILRSTFLHWSSTWPMHTPLENVDTGSFVIIQLRDALGGGPASSSPTTSPGQPHRSSVQQRLSYSANLMTSQGERRGTDVAWMYFPIDLKTVNTGVHSPGLLKPPMSLDLALNKGKGDPISGTRLSFEVLLTHTR